MVLAGVLSWCAPADVSSTLVGRCPGGAEGSPLVLGVVWLHPFLLFLVIVPAVGSPLLRGQFLFPSGNFVLGLRFVLFPFL